ncbi:hypothetical protein [Winogradskyella psychrotolerans]|uniref:hypothetical protein n=1 Tax=Winogradskyella psychrotolerans TaxID=1344585 RepID=UPI001C07A8F2|nr:hypothetical protein [Winogradskyella psychrotolerans]MBU2927996.1 hypothetical protein [Winogradskyella psychrotolerans]
MMKKTRRYRLSTDYFFEAVYGKAKVYMFSDLPAKLATLKILAIMSWFKDIN